MAIKKVIHCSDIHIKNLLRHDEYAEQLTRFIEKCKEISEPYEKEELRIVVAGDLIDQKNNITPELITFVSTFIRELEEIAQVIVIAGNHDLIVNNLSRKDAISSIFETAAFQNSYLLDMELNYQSGCVVDDNITWCLYSIFDNFNQPNIIETQHEHPNNKMIGLYHGMIIGSMLYNGNIVDSGVQGELFEGCDCVMAGDNNVNTLLEFKYKRKIKADDGENGKTKKCYGRKKCIKSKKRRKIWINQFKRKTNFKL